MNQVSEAAYTGCISQCPPMNRQKWSFPGSCYGVKDAQCCQQSDCQMLIIHTKRAVLRGLEYLIRQAAIALRDVFAVVQQHWGVCLQRWKT